ncbi:MAG TPA: hypothetical protein VHV47_03580 [Opitutaceae bacterium]|jgi:hypothetical protein|nr:hypothetical protein [Opitutaceae bacterium]
MKIWFGFKRATPAQLQSSRRSMVKIHLTAFLILFLFFVWGAVRKNLAAELYSALLASLHLLATLVFWWRYQRGRNARVELWGSKPTYRE